MRYKSQPNVYNQIITLNGHFETGLYCRVRETVLKNTTLKW